MLARRISAVIVAALVGGVLLAVPAQAATVAATVNGINYQADSANVAAGATIVGSAAVGPNLVIPSSVDIAGTTYAVKQIGGDAFRNKGLTSVVIPNTVTAIQPYSFAYNLLTTITVPSSVGYINTAAFGYNDLTSITLNEGLTNIGPGAFYDNALTSVVIPATVYTINGSAFLLNPSLTTVTFAGNAPASMSGPSPLGTASTVVKFYADATGFTTPTWAAGGTSYPSQVIPNAVVTFNANGHGTAPAAASGRPGFAASNPGALSASGFTFNGWFTAASGGTQVSFPYTASASATLYAHWSPVQYTVTFDEQNGAAPYGVIADNGSSVWPTAPTFAGHTFAGWWTASTGGTQVTLPVIATGDATVFAHWTLNHYTVTFDPTNGGPATDQAADYSTTVSAPAAPLRTGYTFVGWYTAASGGTQVTFPYTVTGDATVYAHWLSATVSLTLELQNGYGPYVYTLSRNTGVSVSPAAYPGHTFIGWFTEATGGTQVAFPYTMADDTVLFAQWTVNSYSVTLNPENGEAATVIAADHGTEVGAPTDPTRAHYFFMGWFTDPVAGQQIAFPYTAVGDLTLYAHWLVDNHVVIFVPGNGASATNIPADYGTAIDAPPAPIRDNHTFLGWFTAETGGTQLTFPYTVTGNEWAWGRWSQNSFAVTLDALNGEATTTITAPAGSSIPTPQPPTRVGYTFAGWFVPTNEGAQDVAFPYTPAADVTLYARWDRVPATFTAPGQVAPGETIPVTGNSFLPGETVEIWLLSNPVKLATVVVGSDGTFSTNVAIPSGTPAGAHHIEVRGSLSGTLSHAVTVSAALASTGADVAGPALLAGLLMIGGFALVIRRRRSA